MDASPKEHRATLLALLAAYLYATDAVGAGAKLLLWFIPWYFTGGRHWLYLAWHSAGRDFRLFWRGCRALLYLLYFKVTNTNVVGRFRTMLAKFPDRVMYVNATNDEEWTFQQVEDYSNRIANFYLKQGYKKGDSMALFISNRPEQIITWLGLAKIGVIPALINFNLRKDSLIHTIKVADCKGIIYGQELEEGLKDIKEHLCATMGDNFAFYCTKRGSGLEDSVQSTLEGATNQDEECAKSSSGREPESVAKSIHHMDPMFYMYTSGTTGMPKAVIITHIKQLFVFMSITSVVDISADDVIYVYLPLYHSSGVQLGIGGSFGSGAKVVIRPKFSASNLFKDCIKHEATMSQYIGEVARYLLATPKSEADKGHKIRCMFGNGLRAEIWEEFVTRFNIPQIGEFYGATEGNANLINIDNIVGAVGFLPIIWPFFMVELFLPLFLIRVDQETGEPVRDDKGFCIRCEPGEPGEFVGKIVKGDPVKDFYGYKDPTANEKKTISNVFRSGDMYFRSGDYMVTDELSNLTFLDRKGDTFRWHGENVSTTEVEGTVSRILDLKTTTAYGVKIPNMDGRAGMVAVVVEDESEVNFDKLRKGIVDQLPKYARPLFVRLLKDAIMTSTFKLQKNLLQEEGFNPEKIEDPLFFLDPKTGSYVRLDKELHQSIVSGSIRL